MKLNHFRTGRSWIGHVLVATTIMLAAPAALAANAIRGTVYVAALGTHQIFRIDFDYNGNDSFTARTPIPLASVSGLSFGLAIAPNRYLLVAGQGSVSRVKLPTGIATTASPHNNANTIAVDPSGSMAWAGWKDTSLSSLPLQPFGDGTPHSVHGDDGVATEIAFTPANGVFYTTGGEDRNGNVGGIDLNTFTTTRHLSNTEATGIHYDPFSATLIFAAFGKAHQIDPANPGVVLSSRNDSTTGDSYIDLAPDGMGHLLGTWSNATSSTLVLIDYSASGRLGDVSTLHFSTPIGVRNATDVVNDPLLFADGFEP